MIPCVLTDELASIKGIYAKQERKKYPTIRELHIMGKPLPGSPWHFIRGVEGQGIGDFNKLFYEMKDMPACFNFFDILRWWLRINIFCGWKRLHKFWQKLPRLEGNKLHLEFHIYINTGNATKASNCAMDNNCGSLNN